MPIPHPPHRFDPVSGWCSGCGLRDDNRLVSNGTEFRPGPEYSPAELEAFLRRGQTA